MGCLLPLLMIPMGFAALAGGLLLLSRPSHNDWFHPRS